MSGIRLGTFVVLAARNCGRPVPFAVLDDEDLSHDAVIAPRFVRTGMEPHEALADHHADQVRRLLA